MATVIVEEGSNVVNAGGVLGQVLAPISFLLQNWYVLVIPLVFAILLVLLYFFIKKEQEAKKERDELGYYKYKQTISDCIRNRDSKKYKKSYSFFKNIFWLGIPIRWNDESKKIVNKYGKPFGTYRGEVRSQDGTYNLLVCIESTFGLIDKNIIIKIPEKIEMVTEGNTKNNKSNKKEFMYFNLVDNDVDGTIIIKATGIELTSLFYHIPIITRIDIDTGKEEYIDLRKYMEANITDSLYAVQVQRMLNLSTKQMERAMLLNPSLQYSRMSPEKTNPESELDKYDK